MSSRARHQGGRNRRAPSAHIEFLEERWLLSTFTVTNNTDSGPGSLRQAILDANSSKGTATIDFDIQVGAISQFVIPTFNSGPMGITTGPDGNLWFTQANTNQIGRLTPSGTLTEYSVAFITSPAAPAGITAGPDGNLWFTESSGNQIGRITPTGTITTYPVEFGTAPEGITAGPDGNLWFTASGTTAPIISSISPTTGLVTPHFIPDLNAALGITAGPDGNLWFTQPTGNEIGRINPSTGAITEFSLPTAGSYPVGITAGSDGNLWFTEQDGNEIGRINPTTGAIAEFPVPTPKSEPGGITLGPDGNLWFTEATGNQIGRINPTTHAITEFPVPTAGSSPFGITAGPDGNLWFTENVGNQIGRLTLTSSGLTITPTSTLPAITHPVVIDGTTQPGFAGTPIIELDGASAGTGVNGLTIEDTGEGSTVRGLVINRFSGNGIGLTASGNTIVGNFIGTDVTGTIALANGASGLSVFSANNTIGGTSPAARNLISGNGLDGIDLTNGGATTNLVEGNFIGTDITGSSKLGNARHGVVISSEITSTAPGASNNTIGGSVTGAGNLISGNGGYGVDIEGASSTGNLLQGNFIGTDKSGVAAISNVLDGVIIQLGASGNSVGGAASGAGNLISANGGDGIDITGSGSTANLIQGNFIGTDVTGTAALGNLSSGISIDDASSNTVGGTAAGAGNVISGNGTAADLGIGVYVFIDNTAASDSASGNVLQGNDIGTNSAGTSAIVGSVKSVIGVLINEASGNVVQKNVISGNKVIGIEIAGATASSNTGAAASSNLVQGNDIGTNKGGTAKIPNGADGIFINDAAGNTVGGASTDDGNLVSGNGQVGIQLFGLGAHGNLIQNNILGRTATAAVSPGLLNGNSTDLGVYVNTTPGINTIVANIGQGLRESPTGAPFNPGDPQAANAASARAVRPSKPARPFAHRPFFKAASRPVSRAGLDRPDRTALKMDSASLEQLR